jgi:hypothetical protein
MSYLAPSIQIRRKRSPQCGIWQSPNAVYLDGVGHDGDSGNACSSDGLRVTRNGGDEDAR